MPSHCILLSLLIVEPPEMNAVNHNKDVDIFQETTTLVFDFDRVLVPQDCISTASLSNRRVS